MTVLVMLVSLNYAAVRFSMYKMFSVVVFCTVIFVTERHRTHTLSVLKTLALYEFLCL